MKLGRTFEFGYPFGFGCVVHPWTPFQLEGDVYAWWDASQTSSIEMSAGLVSGWTDRIAGVTVGQSTTGYKPTYDPAGIDGRPAILFDGIDDYLSAASAPFPGGTTPCEIWALADQQTSDADTVSRRIGGYGDTATFNSNGRQLIKGRVGATNTAGIIVGTGASSINARTDSVATLFNGVHVVRGIVGADSAQSEIDGLAGSIAASVPATTSSATVIGVGLDLLTGPWKGYINSFLITKPLSAEKAAALYGFLLGRGGVG